MSDDQKKPKTASELVFSSSDLLKAFSGSAAAAGPIFGSPIFTSGGLGELTVAGSPFFAYPDQEKVRSLEDEIRKVRDNLNKMTRNLQEEKDTAAGHKQRVTELNSTLDELAKKQQFRFLLERVSPEAADVLLDSEPLRAEFLSADARPLFAMSVDIRRSTDLMLKARTPQGFATFITPVLLSRILLRPRRWLLRTRRCRCVPQHI
jgi:hypothetical protein